MSRFDSAGMFWEDLPPVKKERAAAIPRAQRWVDVPPTGWVPPKEFPNLKGIKLLGLDTETKDLELLDRGPGAVRGAAHIVGVSVATHDKSWYFPMRHEYEPQMGLNLPPDKVLAWLNDLVSEPLTIVGANLLYDLENLRAEGVRIAPKSTFCDVQLAEPLLDEQRYTYALESLAQSYLGAGKESPLLYKWCSDSFGGPVNGEQRANIWRAPPSLVGPYAESDALLPLQILEKQRIALEAEQLSELFSLECRLIPLLLDMRFRGVRIDVERAQAMAIRLREQAAEAQKLIPSVDVWSGASIERAFKAAGHQILYTEAGNPSFTKQWLEAQNHDLARSILDVRLFEKSANPFLESYLLGNVHKGRVHCQFHPMRSDEYGTVSGRFSSSNPNLQNIPSRHKIIGPAIRSLYIPEEGCKWARFDHSQIEYRALIHYAVGKGSDELREQYKTNPNTDFHQVAIDMTRKITGITLDRTPAKNLNFGLCIAEDSLVLTDRGNVAIQNVTRQHRIWDGIEWVSHEGLVCNGKKEVITYDDITATPDHIVWTKEGYEVPLWQAAHSMGRQRLAITASAEDPVIFKGDSNILREGKQRWLDSQETSGTKQTNGSPASKTCRVFDLINAGPRNRFTVNSKLVHNCYGMGKDKLTRSLGVSQDVGQRLYDAYFEALPSVKETAKSAQRLASRRGYIRTALGRRRRFNKFKDGTYGKERIGVHAALNSCLQGTSADILKKGMVDAYEAGLLEDDACGMFSLTVHDEVDLSKLPTEKAAKAFIELKYVLENCVKLRVPLIAVMSEGDNWGQCK